VCMYSYNTQRKLLHIVDKEQQKKSKKSLRKSILFIMSIQHFFIFFPHTSHQEIFRICEFCSLATKNSQSTKKYFKT